ncbi:MAG: 16S rRNA (guanine(527)-N(7))-methyltransferase RsmG [Microscillaceae bacterium]|nr:16S rRNA (guanine(527)-N(7))-methyltransferase RsmG [Microscillaceae bacterium]
MNGIELILKYFPELTSTQIDLFTQMEVLYQDWNQKINVVSRKDVELLYERHVLHSLSIAKVIQFKPKARIMDVGTGGGFPGIPLAIMFPESEFYLVDSIGKKIKVVQEVLHGLQLANACAEQIRMEEVDDHFDFVVNRAVAPLNTLLHWTRGKYNLNWNHKLKNGLISLKGGDLSEEIQEAKIKKCKIYEISDFFEEEFFETKKVVYVPMI